MTRKMTETEKVRMRTRFFVENQLNEVIEGKDLTNSLLISQNKEIVINLIMEGIEYERLRTPLARWMTI